MPVGRYPDGLAYAASAGEIRVSDEEGHAESVVEVGARRRIRIIAPARERQRYGIVTITLRIPLPPGAPTLRPST